MSIKFPVSVSKDVQLVVAVLAGASAVITAVLQSPVGPLVPSTWTTLLSSGLTLIATVSGFLKSAEKFIDDGGAL